LARFLFLRQTQGESLQDFCFSFDVIGLDGVFWVFIIHFSPERKKGRKFKKESYLEKKR